MFQFNGKESPGQDAFKDMEDTVILQIINLLGICLVSFSF